MELVDDAAPAGLAGEAGAILGALPAGVRDHAAALVSAYADGQGEAAGDRGGVPRAPGTQRERGRRNTMRHIANGLRRRAGRSLKSPEELERAKGFEPSTPTLATGARGIRQGIRGSARLRLTVFFQCIEDVFSAARIPRYPATFLQMLGIRSGEGYKGHTSKQIAHR